jgi:hypothetical protein
MAGSIVLIDHVLVLESTKNVTRVLEILSASERGLQELVDNDTLVDSDEETVYSHDTEAAYANGNMYTNCANDNSMEIGTRLASMYVSGK